MTNQRRVEIAGSDCDSKRSKRTPSTSSLFTSRRLICLSLVLISASSAIASSSLPLLPSHNSPFHSFTPAVFPEDTVTASSDQPTPQSTSELVEAPPSSPSLESAVVIHPQFTTAPSVSPPVRSFFFSSSRRRRPLLLPALPYPNTALPSTPTFMSAIAFNTQKTAKLAVYFFFLYFFTVVYNVANKKVVEYLPLPATVAALQTLIGIPMFLPLWMLKPPRNFDSMDRNSLMKIALCHGLGNLATVYALQSGSVSFTHVVKSAEPLFTAFLSIVIMKSSLPLPVYISLIPIVVGVGLASVKEMSFTWFGFIAAMASNLFYQLRMVLSKVLFNGGDDNPHTKLSAANTFRVITIFSFMQLVPIALILEGNQIPMAIKHLLTQPGELRLALLNLLISGMSFYLYNEIGFWILDLVHPVSHAVGNTIKRVVLIFASILIFHNPVNSLGMTGSAIAILGSFLYALASQKTGISPSASSSSLPLTTVHVNK